MFGVISMNRAINIFAFLTFILSFQSFAQNNALPVYTAATNDKAYIIIVNAPEDMESFFVSRKDPNDRDFLRLNKIPIGPLVDPAAVRSVLGDDYNWIVRALRASDDFEVTRRLQADKGISAVLSLASLNAARAAGRLFIDEGVEEGETYSYKITFLNYEAKILSEEYRDIEISNSLPIPPTSVVGDAGDQKVEIQWDYPDYRGNKKDIVVGFNLYRKSGTDDYEKINKVLIMRQDELKERTDFGVQNNIQYGYYLTAVDCIGRESSPSEEVIAKPLDLTPPSFPQGLELHEEDGFILLSWNMNLELDLSHYDIFRSMDVHTGYNKINDIPVQADMASYTDTNVYFGPTYYYKIKATDLSGNESEFSNIISGKPVDSKPPASPSNVKTSIVNNYVRLTWTAPKDNDVQGYYIYRRRSDLEFLRIVNLPLEKDTLNFVDKGYSERGLWQGQTYYYAISSIDNFFNESEKKIIEIQIPDNEPPESPVSSYANSRPDGLVEIIWQPSMSLDVTNYRIYRSRDNDPLRMIMETPDSIFGKIDSTAIRGIVQNYQVVAVDMSGNESKKTKIISVIPKDINPPHAPENISAIVQSNGVRINWEQNNENDLLGYNIYRSDIPNGIPIKLNDQPIKNNEYNDPEGSAGLYYKVSSLDTSKHENNSGEAVEAISNK
jgi:fibronectin type 3 domain-containing protein